MRIAFVSVENSLIAIGFRKMVALVRLTKPELGVFHVVPFKATSILTRLKSKEYRYEYDHEIESIASHLAKWDMVCFSSMSTHAEYVRNLILSIRTKNPNSFIVWGGIHSIVDPEDAIRYADAVCVGEGEKAFLRFLTLFSEGHDYTHVENFYFNNKGHVIRNTLLPLHKSKELESFPYPLLGDGELLFKIGRGFVPIEPLDYVHHEGLIYNTIWSIGCPGRCIYCANSKFLKYHRDYSRLRFPSVDYIVGEVLHARKRYPHLSSVTFHDDMFMAIPSSVLEEFAEKWRDKIGLPFAVQGLRSRYVDPLKMKTLISAGMFRVRMGIQSGSPRTLKFYKRHDSPESIKRAVSVINSFSKYIMTPSYDLIADNPIETTDDIAATIKLLNQMPRPLIINVFPLMKIPGTELEEIAKEKKLDLPLIKQAHPTDSYMNILIHTVCLLRFPERVLKSLLKRRSNSNVVNQTYPIIGQILRTCHILKRALAHLMHGHFSVITNKIAWILWKINFVEFGKRRILRTCSLVLTENSSDKTHLVR